MGYAMLYNVNMYDIPRRMFDVLMLSNAENMTVALDLETTGLDPTENCIASCSLYVPGVPTEIIMCSGRPPRLIEALSYSKATFIMHYAPFDLSFLNSCFRCVPDNVICTKSAEKIIDPLRGKYGLQDLIKFYYGVHIDKQRRQNPDWSSPTEEDFEYMCRDVVFLHGIWEFQKRQLARLDREALAQKVFDGLHTNARLKTLGIDNIYAY